MEGSPEKDPEAGFLSANKGHSPLFGVCIIKEIFRITSAGSQWTLHLFSMPYEFPLWFVYFQLLELLSSRVSFIVASSVIFVPMESLGCGPLYSVAILQFFLYSIISGYGFS